MLNIDCRAYGLFWVLFLVCLCSACGQSTVTVDYSVQAGPPLIKTKFSVYQTPLAPMSRLERDMPLLGELNIHSLRFETAWGKSIDFNAPSITGMFPDFNYKRTGYTHFLKGVIAQSVNPLLTVGYTPEPLKPGSDWRDKPKDMRAWHKITNDFAAYWKQTGVNQIDYEIWNEPDLNIFFKGTKTDYFDIYKAGSAGIKQGDPNAKVGGPVTAFSAWYKDFLNFVKTNKLPLDFLSGHAYAEAPKQLNAMRAALGKSGWPNVETYITEYASYITIPNTDIAEGGKQQRFVAAADFLKDTKMLLDYTELTKVYWAQWLDVELLTKQGKWYYHKGMDKMGLVDLYGRRKALFNGFKIYNRLPVDRNKVAVNGNVDAMASSDAHKAALVIWNTTITETQVNACLNKLPFKKGKVHIYRIDTAYSSYFENKRKDELELTENIALESQVFNWKGSLPGKGVVYIEISDDTGLTELMPNKVAQDIHMYHWFQDRGNNNYADFDSHTWIARLGMGTVKDTALSQIGVEMKEVPACIRITAETFGDLRDISANSLLGYRFDFEDNDQKYVKSILFYGILYHSKRAIGLPWGKGSNADLVQLVDIKDATIDLAKLVPPHFSGKMMLSFILQDTGKNTGVKFKVFSSSKTLL